MPKVLCMPKFFHWFPVQKKYQCLSVYFQIRGASLNASDWGWKLMANISEFKIFKLNYYNGELFLDQFHCISIKYCIQKMWYECIYCALTTLGFINIPHRVLVCFWFRSWIGGSSIAPETHLYHILLELLLCWLHTLFF